MIRGTRLLVHDFMQSTPFLMGLWRHFFCRVFKIVTFEFVFNQSSNILLGGLILNCLNIYSYIQIGSLKNVKLPRYFAPCFDS